MTAEVEAPPQRLYSSPLGLYGFQADGVAVSYWRLTQSEEPVDLVLFDTGIGKAGPLSEPVLTPEGWSTMGKVQPGDHVIGQDGRPTEVLAVHPQESRECYRVTFSDGSWTRCSPDHLWQVTHWGSDRSLGTQRRVRRTEVLTVRQILDRGVQTAAGRRRFSIPITEPVQYPEVDLPMDPYELGIVLGDGWISPRGQVHLSTDREIVEGLTVRGTVTEQRGCTRLTTGAWAEAMHTLHLVGCRSHEKHVPEVYQRSCETQRRALLAGLLDTDGSPIASGGVEFSTTSEMLADAVVELAESLGGLGKKSRPRVTRYLLHGEQHDGKPSWRVNVKMPEQPFRLSRKAERWVQPAKYPVARWIESVEQVEDEDQVCISIDRPDGLYLTRHHVVTHNSHLAMATAAMLFEDDLVDVVVVVAEAAKITDWAKDDFPTFTSLDARLYSGPPAKRRKMLADMPQVLVMSYETGRNDICGFKAKSRAVSETKMLTEALLGKRVMICFDEFSKLRSRSAKSYIAWDYLVNRALRKSGPAPMLLGLTATTVENSPEDHWNAGRILAPWRAGNVSWMHETYVASWDLDGNPVGWKNLTASECAPGVVPLNRLFGPITQRKSKFDADVIDQFPAKIENPPTWVDLHPDHQNFYEQIEEIFAPTDVEVQRIGTGVLRMIADHPTSLLHAQGDYAKRIVEAVGADFLLGLEVAKVEALLTWQHRMATQQTVIFTFYGNTVLPLLEQTLRSHGYAVAVNRSALSREERQHAQAMFKAGDAQIYLSSDAGARGLNLGMGSGLLHYEHPCLYSTFVQRSDRIHRIDSRHPSVTIDGLLAKNTIEEPLYSNMLKRNEWGEKVQEDDYVEDLDPGERRMRASDRMALFRQGS